MKASKKKTTKPTAYGEDVFPSEALRDELRSFIEHHPARRFSRNLRSMLIEFLMFEGATEARYLQDLLYDLEGLFGILDILESEESAIAETDKKH